MPLSIFHYRCILLFNKLPSSFYFFFGADGFNEGVLPGVLLLSC
jgi:hypothetical protein